MMSYVYGATTAAFLVTCAVIVPRKVASLVPKKESESLLFFDGVCNLCQAFVGFALRHDTNERVKFGVIQKQGELMKRVGAGAYAEGGDQFLRTVVLVQDGRVYVRSDAALRIIALFDAPVKYLAVLHVLPVGCRDWGYKKVAKWRYRLFGQSENIRDPPAIYKARFL